MKTDISALLVRYSKEYSDFEENILEHSNKKGRGDDALLHMAARYGFLMISLL